MEKTVKVHDLTQGEKLLILVFRAKSRDPQLKITDIAAALDVTSTYLPIMYKKKTLTEIVKKKATDYFNVSPQFFDPDYSMHEMQQEMKLLRQEIGALKNRERELSEEIILLQAALIRQRRADLPGGEPPEQSDTYLQYGNYTYCCLAGPGGRVRPCRRAAQVRLFGRPVFRPDWRTVCGARNHYRIPAQAADCIDVWHQFCINIGATLRPGAPPGSVQEGIQLAPRFGKVQAGALALYLFHGTKC
jgi:hypothetical protein